MLDFQLGDKMSAPSCIAYVGLRFTITDDEVEALEERRGSRQIEARNAGLKSYWGNFGLGAPSYVLLVGSQLGTVGPEGQTFIRVDGDELVRLVERTREQLASTTMNGGVGLHVEYQPD